MISRQLELWGVSSKSCCSLGGESEDLKIQDVEALELWNCEAKTFFSSVCGAESNTTNAGNGTNCTRDVGYIIDPNDPKCKTHCLVSVGSQFADPAAENTAVFDPVLRNRLPTWGCGGNVLPGIRCTRVH
eukprot:3227713-Rhodomonas_salina.1